MDSRRSYCRLCAEKKSFDKLFNLEVDKEKCHNVFKMLTYMNAPHIDVSDQNFLPKTVCFICWDSLNKAYEFLNKLKEAQSVLKNIFPKVKSLNNDVNTGAAEEYFASKINNQDHDERRNIPIFKVPENPKATSQLYKDNQIKVEPKEESDEDTEDLGDIGTVVPAENYEASLNVQALLDAAMNDVPFDSNVTIYAKELPAIPKKVIRRWKDYPWHCLQCSQQFVNLDSLRDHYKVTHHHCASFFCIDCRETASSYTFDRFIKHVAKHRRNLRHICPYCDLKIDNISEHIKSHMRKPSRPCKTCGEVFKSSELLEKHANEYSIVKSAKPRRKRGTPLTIQDLTCELCNKVYKNQNSLRDHKKLHTADRKRNYTCDRCGKTFYNKGTLTTHIMSHDAVRPHRCRICYRSFLFPNMLRRHVEMHSGIKPFSCEQCGRCFRLQYQLNAHKIIHTDSLPYICQYCSKAFRFKQILKNHERQHTGAKPYSCQLCNMEFTNWSNYNKHMKRRHNTDTSKKKITPEGVFPVNPETGLLMQIEDPVATEEWKNEIMVPVKRGKKKVKVEKTN